MERDMNRLLRDGFDARRRTAVKRPEAMSDAELAQVRQQVSERVAARPVGSGGTADAGARERSGPPRQLGMNDLLRSAADAAKQAPTRGVVFIRPPERVNVGGRQEER